MDWPDDRIGHLGLCPACVALLWCDRSDSGGTISCPHCARRLYWLIGRFHISESQPDYSSDREDESDAARDFWIPVFESLFPNSDSQESIPEEFDLITWHVPHSILLLIPEKLAFTLCAVPLALEADGALLIAISDPMDFAAIDKLRFIANREIRCITRDREAILEALLRAYRSDS
jgi:hypothetical protein